MEYILLVTWILSGLAGSKVLAASENRPTWRRDAAAVALFCVLLGPLAAFFSLTQTHIVVHRGRRVTEVY